MRLLVDTTLFIEVLLNQVSAGQARTFLENRKGHELFVTDFALHSVGVLLFRQGQHQVFRQLVATVSEFLTVGTCSGISSGRVARPSAPCFGPRSFGCAQDGERKANRFF